MFNFIKSVVTAKVEKRIEELENLLLTAPTQTDYEEWCKLRKMLEKIDKK